MSNISFTEQMNDDKIERRDFILTAIKATAAGTLLGIPVAGMAEKYSNGNVAYTVEDIMNIILKEIPGAPFANTVDTLKSGTAKQNVTGIVTTMFATVNVIREAAKLNANFIIAHEPTFYNHTDDINWTANNDIVKQKRALLQQHNIAVWRFHDYWHTYRPDGIQTGVLKMAGWQQYLQAGEPLLKIPPMSLKNIIDHLKASLKIKHIKAIGNMDQVCERIGLIPGAAGGQSQISFAEKQKPDVLIIGEVHEWETAEYIRDGRLFGSKTALVILGHSVSEEPGMQFLVEWLQPRINGIKVTHIASEDPFTWV